MKGGNKLGRPEGAAKTIARWVALIALFLIPLTPLIVANTFYFPFITGKAFYFRILVEVAVAAWVVLACLDKEYRPRFSWAGVAILAFVAWMLIADSFALNAEKAFWSNFERMEGWILLIHLAGFFFAASAVLRVEKKWREWFLASLAVAVVVSIHGILQQLGALPIHQGSTRIDASFGNSAYLAIYLLFNTFIAGWLALTEKRTWLKWSLLVFAVIEAFLIFLTETRGTVLGLIGALALCALIAACTAGKHARRLAVGGLILIIVVSGGLWLARDSSFVEHNHVLQRVTSVSLAAGDVRFMIWDMAWQGFVSSPKTVILGWGQEGFNYVFDRFYNPDMYQQEPWFDRAHNAFIDWLDAGGAPGFLLYVSLFIAAFWLLWNSSELSRAERIALTAALAGYACHNLFVFDNLYSYVYFFAILALIDSQVSRPMPFLEAIPEFDAAVGITYILPIAIIAGGVVIWYVNVPGIITATELITAISSSPSGPSANIATFQDLVTHPAFASQEVREQLVSFASSIAQDPDATDEEKQEITSLAVDQMKQQVARYPHDTREEAQLVYAYQAAGDMTDALAAANTATKLSPTMENIWILAGATAWGAGNYAEAAADFAQAYALGPQFQNLAAYAAAGAYANNDAAKGDSILEQAYGTTTVDSDILSAAYYQAKDWSRLVRLWRLRASAPGASIQTEFSLAAAYYAAGDTQNALSLLGQIEEEYPDASSSVDAAMKEIRAGAPLQ